jgi:hypothetical protein
MNFIYITTNLINGKQYVGSHNGTEDDNYLGSGKPAFSNALKKYRKENFKREVLEFCENKKQQHDFFATSTEKQQF